MKKHHESSVKQKRELLRILKREHYRGKDKSDFSRMVIVLEMRKVNPNQGLLKLEYYSNDVLTLAGSIIIPITPVPGQPSAWDTMSIGDSQFFPVAIDTREASLRDQVGGFIKRTLEGSRLQDFLPWGGSSSK